MGASPAWFGGCGMNHPFDLYKSSEGWWFIRLSDAQERDLEDGMGGAAARKIENQGWRKKETAERNAVRLANLMYGKKEEPVSALEATVRKMVEEHIAPLEKRIARMEGWAGYGK